MAKAYLHDLLVDPAELARYQGWSESVYRDLLGVQSGELSQQVFDERYLRETTIFVLDLTGFTQNAMHGGSVRSFLRILNAHKVCLPVLREAGAVFVRTFADDVVGLFDQPGVALDAAFEIHRRVELFQSSNPSDEVHWECAIGIGFGPVYEIGPNHAMGDEMNRASKLGEDTARGGETLVTESVQHALGARHDIAFEPQASDDLLFPYFRVAAKG